MEKITIDILSIGGYSKAIVLPKEWLKQNNLDVGNKVKLTLDSNSITIVPYNKETKNIDMNKLLEKAKENSSTEEELLKIADKE